MKILVDHNKAYEVILEAIARARGQVEPRSPYSTEISEVILGSHLTYRYILVTGLLAKATDNRVNPLSIQASAHIDGAYDARSLCHGVIVGRVENDFLQGRLGASNEPFLNKPARFPIHSTANAVRNGKDRVIQRLSVDILKSAITQEIAFDMLVDAMYFTLQRENRTITATIGHLFDFNAFLSLALRNSCDGESCAIITALSLMLLEDKNEWQVVAHPVNQAGSSSKEILDVDIYSNSQPLISFEVKDKPFSLQDVSHAVHKALSSGVRNVIFIKGPRANALDFLEQKAICDAKGIGATLTFIDIQSFSSTCYALSGCTQGDILVRYINIILKSIRAKDGTVKHFESIFSV
ncbi:TPA: restriction endonuclease, SacI family [Serratia fonticola]|nr:restriction endonuclease, SacI family [Serratia fonticola]